MQLKTLQNSIKDFLQDNAPADFMLHPASGLNIYKQNYFKNLSKALAAKYPTATRHLGSNLQKTLYDFIRAYPSTSPNLDDYGTDFAKYLIDNDNLVTATLAQIDLEMFLSFIDCEKSISGAELARVTPIDFDRLTLKLNKALRLIKVNAQDFEIWRELNRDLPIFNVTDQEQGISLNLTISLIKDQIIINIVPASYYKAFALMKNQENVLGITAVILAIDSDFNLSKFLTFCFNNHLITGFELK